MTSKAQIDAAKAVLHSAKAASIAWRATWFMREKGGPLTDLLVVWVMAQKDLAKQLSVLLPLCDYDADKTGAALDAAAREVKA